MKNLFSKIYATFKKNYKMLIFDIVIISIFCFLCYYPFPYVIYRPGGLINLNERVTVEDAKEIIGSYNMTYVTMAKGTFPNLLLAFLFEGWDIQKDEGTLYDGNYEQNFRLSQLDLQNSVDTAKLVAFRKAGYDVKIHNKQLVVHSVEKNAETDIQILDRIEKINGISVMDFDDIRTYINTLNIGDEVILEVETDTGRQTRKAIIYEYNGHKVVGITFMELYDYETDKEVEFKSKSSEAGSSGGLMLTLTIYDHLIEKDLTGGKIIAGTGTMDANGNVGEIGGIKYKLLGAEKKGAEVYLAPIENCDEAQKVYKEYDLGFNLKCVSTFDEAVNYLNSIN